MKKPERKTINRNLSKRTENDFIKSSEYFGVKIYISTVKDSVSWKSFLELKEKSKFLP